MSDSSRCHVGQFCLARCVCDYGWADSIDCSLTTEDLDMKRRSRDSLALAYDALFSSANSDVTHESIVERVLSLRMLTVHPVELTKTSIELSNST